MAKIGYVGNTPNASSVIVARQIYDITTSVGIVTFNSVYTPGYVDVYLNGVRLIEGKDYSAGDGRVINLSANAQAGDSVEVVAYKAFNLSTSPVGIQSAGQTIKLDSVSTLNFVGAGNTFKVNGSTVDIAISGSAGLGTALSQDKTSILSSIFKTPRTATVTSGESVTVESDATSGNIAFMREGVVVVESGATLTVGSGTTLVTDVLDIF